MALRDLIRPNWQHSDPEVRLNAVSALGVHETETLMIIAHNDPDERVRLTAIDHLDNQHALEQLAASDASCAVIKAVMAKLDTLFFEQVLKLSDDGTRLAALSRIGSEDLLVDIVVQTDDDSIRLAAIDRIAHETILQRVVCESISNSARIAALTRISDTRLLKKIARNGPNKTIKRVAQEKLAELEAEKNRPSADELRMAQLTALCEEAERVQESWNWDYAQRCIDTVTTEWQKWDASGDHLLYTRFDAACRHFATRHQQFVQRQAEEHERTAKRRQLMALREALCLRVEDLIGTDSEVALNQVSDARSEWETTIDVTGDDASELATRFANACDQFDTEYRTAVARQAANDIAREQLAEYCIQAESLAQQDDWQGAENDMRKLHTQWEKTAESLADIDALHHRYAVARQTLLDKRQAYEAELQAQRDAIHTQQKQCCDAIEALADADAPLSVSADALKAQWETLKQHRPSRELRERFRQASRRLAERQRQAREERKWEQWAGVQQREALCEAAEALANETDLFKVAESIKSLQRQWKSAGDAPRGKANALWQRFHAACEAEFRRCKTFFAERDHQRAENLARKRALCEHAESVNESTDWDATSAVLKQLQTEWKSIPSAAPRDEKTVSARFQAACDHFFSRRRAHFNELDTQRKENAAYKATLCEKAEALANSTEWQSANAGLRNLQTEWKETGNAGKQDEQHLWKRFRCACDLFYNRLDEQRPENRRRKEQLCEEVESLLAPGFDALDINNTASRLIELQKTWRSVGPVPQDDADAIWARFHQPCDAFFRQRRQHLDTLTEIKERNQAEKEELLFEVERLVDSTDWDKTATALKELQSRWQNIGPAADRQERELSARFRRACDQFFANRRSHYGELQEQRLANLRAKEALCLRIETLAGIVDRSSPADKQTLSVADQLRIAIETNFVAGDDIERSESHHQSARDEVLKIQSSWREIGPVPLEQGQTLQTRYRAACDQFFAQQKRRRPPQSPRRVESAEQMLNNQTQKEALCAKVEACASNQRPETELDTVKRCQQEWKRIGRVPSKGTADQLWSRFNTACDTVYSAVRAARERGTA